MRWAAIVAVVAVGCGHEQSYQLAVSGPPEAALAPVEACSREAGFEPTGADGAMHVRLAEDVWLYYVVRQEREQIEMTVHTMADEVDRHQVLDAKRKGDSIWACARERLGW